MLKLLSSGTVSLPMHPPAAGCPSVQETMLGKQGDGGCQWVAVLQNAPLISVQQDRQVASMSGLEKQVLHSFYTILLLISLVRLQRSPGYSGQKQQKERSQAAASHDACEAAALPTPVFTMQCRSH